MKNEEVIVLYNFSPKRLEAVRVLLQPLKVRIAAFGAEDAGQKVGFAAGIKGFARTDKAAEGAAFANELLIFQGFTRARMDKALAAFEEAKAEKVRYKAIVTLYNRFWTLQRLGHTMEKEHGAMQNRAGKAARQEELT